jgi:hypothetical protein
LRERFVAVLAYIINPVTTLRSLDLPPAVKHSLFDHVQRFNIFVIPVHSFHLQGCKLMG